MACENGSGALVRFARAALVVLQGVWLLFVAHVAHGCASSLPCWDLADSRNVDFVPIAFCWAILLAGSLAGLVAIAGKRRAASSDHGGYPAGATSDMYAAVDESAELFAPCQSPTHLLRRHGPNPVSGV